MIRLLLGLLGVTGLIVAMPLLIGGGTALMVDSTSTDDQGFITSTPIDVEVDGYALVAGPAEIDVSPDIPLQLGGLVAIRLDVVNKSQSPSRGVFVGIAESTTVDEYLGGVPYAIVDDADEDSMILTYRMPDEGDATLAPPAEQPFWIVSSSGAGPQGVTWEVDEVDEGTYSLVVMNEDAVDGLNFEARVGARVPALKSIGVGLLIGGSVAMALGALLLALAIF
jgi:hypothetical protein